MIKGPYENIAVWVGLRYQQTYGPRFDVRKFSRGIPYAQPQVEIVRYVIAPKDRKHPLPPTHLISRHLAQFTASADPATRELIRLCRNNHGGYLLEVPQVLRNEEAAALFLGWLDRKISKEHSHETEES